jgi:hypothetical protein
MRSFVFFISISIFFISCKKDIPACTGNCADIVVSGKVYDATNNIGFSKVPLTIDWFSNHRNCIFCPASKRVYSGSTDKNGNFNFTITIDSSLFLDYDLTLRVPNQPEYLSYSNDYFESQLYKYNPTGFQNTQFKMYPKANLTIRLHRVQNDNFTYFLAEHYYLNGSTYGDYIIAGQQFAESPVINTVTSANIYTKISWKKVFSPGVFTQQVDSLICTKNGNNFFDIFY